MDKPGNPMLACSPGTDAKAEDVVAEFFKHHGSAVVVPKIDGIRCLFYRGVAWSRKLEPLPSPFLQATARQLMSHLEAGYGLISAGLAVIDCEVFAGDPWAPDVYNKTTQAAMKGTGYTPVGVCIIDCYRMDPGHGGAEAEDPGFTRRMQGLGARAESLLTDTLGVGCWRVQPTECRRETEAWARVQHYLSQGYEGAMLRLPHAPYKHGRSTMREGGLVKVKPFADCEAVVTGVVEQMHNGNDLQTSATGYAKRSSAKAGKTGKGRMGALQVRIINGPFSGASTQVGNFTDADRAAFWIKPPLGRVATIRYLPCGSKDTVRHPVFYRWREDDC